MGWVSPGRVIGRGGQTTLDSGYRPGQSTCRGRNCRRSPDGAVHERRGRCRRVPRCDLGSTLRTIETPLPTAGAPPSGTGGPRRREAMAGAWPRDARGARMTRGRLLGRSGGRTWPVRGSRGLRGRGPSALRRSGRQPPTFDRCADHPPRSIRGRRTLVYPTGVKRCKPSAHFPCTRPTTKAMQGIPQCGDAVSPHWPSECLHTSTVHRARPPAWADAERHNPPLGLVTSMGVQACERKKARGHGRNGSDDAEDRGRVRCPCRAALGAVARARRRCRDHGEPRAVAPDRRPRSRGGLPVGPRDHARRQDLDDGLLELARRPIQHRRHVRPAGGRRPNFTGPAMHQAPYSVAVDPRNGDFYFGDVDAGGTVDKYTAPGSSSTASAVRSRDRARTGTCIPRIRRSRAPASSSSPTHATTTS